MALPGLGRLEDRGRSHLWRGQQGGGRRHAAWASLSGEELLDVTLHERTTLSGEEFNLEDWQAVLEDPILADKQAELQETLDKWEAEPPVE